MSFRADPIRVLVLAVALGAAAVVALAVWSSQRLPDGPVEPAYDQHVCELCKMHVGEPRFAAQLQTPVGDVFFYDDPGCLAEHLAADAPGGQRLDVHAIWFHHLRRDGWVRSDRAGFVAVTPTPMGFGFGVLDADEPGTIPFDEFRRRVAAVKAESK